MLLADVVAASTAIAATRSRLAKVAELVTLLRAADPDEIEVITAIMAGHPRQGRIGIGWRALSEARTAVAAEPTLRVLECDAALSELAAINGTGSTGKRATALRALFGRCTEAEQDLLIRLIGGELRHGALEGVMTEAIAVAAEVPADQVRRAFMLSGSLTVTAQTALIKGTAALAEFGLEVGRPVRPMLASPAKSVAEAVAGLGEVTVEHKLDGARIQVHRNGDEVHVFTRTLREITASVPELVQLVRSLPGETVVLDGETLALTDEGTPRPFQETQSRFGAESPRELLLRPYFFDILHYNGRDLLDEPLRVRRAVLAEAAPGYVVESGSDTTDQVLADALSAGHEGVVVKALDSVYAAGRRGASWQKVKPVHTLDLVVRAVEWGHGRRTGYLSNLHLGARDPDGGQPIMVGKTFKGLTDELLAWQTQALQRIQTSATEHVVTVAPELVVEIALDGVQRSTRYPGGIALRFARVLRYRDDKSAAEADTIEAVRALLP